MRIQLHFIVARKDVIMGDIRAERPITDVGVTPMDLSSHVTKRSAGRVAPTMC